MNYFFNFWLYGSRKYREDVPAFSWVEQEREIQIQYDVFLKDVLERSRTYSKLSQKRVGLWGENSYRWIVSAFSLLAAGKCVILLDANLQNEEMLHLAEYTDCELIIASDTLMEEKEYFKSHFPMLDMELKNFTGNLDGNQEVDEEGELIFFTSGTSSSAKGVVFSAASFVQCTQLRISKGTWLGKRRDRWFIPVPFHHMYGFEMISTALMKGGTVCIGTSPRLLVPEIKMLKPNVAVLVPTMVSFLLDNDRLPETIKEMVSAGGVCDKRLERQARERGVTLYNMFGSSETNGSAAVSDTMKGVEWLRPVGNARWIRNEEGMLGVSHELLMKGYYKRPDETAEVLRDGVMWTGDVGEIDEDGYVHIAGRVRDTIVLRNGKKIHAGDLERELEELPGVLEAVAVGVNGVLTAVLVPDKNSTYKTLQQEIANLNRKKPISHQIKRIVISEKRLPRTSTGKIRRFMVAQNCQKEEGQ